MGSGPIKNYGFWRHFYVILGRGWGEYEERGGAYGSGLKLSLLRCKKGSVWGAVTRKNEKWMKKGWRASWGASTTNN